MRISSARVFSGPCVAGACVGTRSWGAQRYEVCACVAYGHGSMRIRASGTTRVTNN